MNGLDEIIKYSNTNYSDNYNLQKLFLLTAIVSKRLHVFSLNLSWSWSLVFLLNSTRVFATRSIMKENPEHPEKATSIYEFVATDIDGNVIDFESYRGNVLVIVNVASKCGYTSKHITELNELHAEFHDKGLRILGKFETKSLQQNLLDYNHDF